MSSLLNPTVDPKFGEDPSDAARRRFPTLSKLAYLNSGSYGLLSDAVRAAMLEYLDHRQDVGADWDAWVVRSMSLADKMARLLDVRADEIAITASASAGINTVASALDFSGERNRIVVSNYEFPTSGQIWHAQERRGAIVEHVAEDDRGLIPFEHFERLIDDRTRIVAIAHVCYRHGAKLPDDEIRAIADLAHRHGAYVILDCFQSIGAVPIYPERLGVDFMVGGMYKYLLSSAGVGFLYARDAVVKDLVPTVSGWFAQDRIGDMDIFRNDPSQTATRFQAGTPPVPSCYAADAGVGLVLDYGIDAIAERVRGLTAYAVDRFMDEGFPLATPADPRLHGPMLAIRSTDAGALVQALIGRDIVTSHRDGNVRAGLHFYNNRDDIDRLVAALCDHRDLLA